jgi:hypothetical protein
MVEKNKSQWVFNPLALFFKVEKENVPYMNQMRINFIQNKVDWMCQSVILGSDGPARSFGNPAKISFPEATSDVTAFDSSL